MHEYVDIFPHEKLLHEPGHVKAACGCCRGCLKSCIPASHVLQFSCMSHFRRDGADAVVLRSIRVLKRPCDSTEGCCPDFGHVDGPTSAAYLPSLKLHMSSWKQDPTGIVLLLQKVQSCSKQQRGLRVEMPSMMTSALMSTRYLMSFCCQTAPSQVSSHILSGMTSCSLLVQP